MNRKSPTPTFPHQRGLADKLGKISETRDTAPHLIVEARAGTGKTTTLVEGLNLLKGYCPQIDPSPQQSAIWKSILLSKNSAHTVCFVAFNKSIATELQQRVPEGCDAMTMHSMGFRAIRNAYATEKMQVNTYRVRDLLAEMLGYADSFDLHRDRPEFLNAVEKLVSLCKMNLVDPCGQDQLASIKEVSGFHTGTEALAQLAAHYDVDLNNGAVEIFETVPKVLELCKDVAKDRQLDFDDMIWLPIVLNLNVYRYDLLLVDEDQDLNCCQQQLALKSGRRLILCGDSRQAIYGFAGADSESMSRMRAILSKTGRGCITLPLTVTRRCGRAIVREAQKIVSDFEAHETCSDGLVHSARFKDVGAAKTAPLSESCYRGYVGDGDMVLCRVNAPLVSECFKFIRDGRKANIQGRDIGQGLISTVNRLTKSKPGQSLGIGEPCKHSGCLSHRSHPCEGCGRIHGGNDEMALLLYKLHRWLDREERKENAKRNPSDAKLIALHDRHNCIVCFTEDCNTVKEVTDKISAVFSDNDTEGIKLSSVHKAKGLEARRVFLLRPEGATIPHPMAKTPWQREQEYNLLYVAITRAIEELVYVT